MHVDLGPVRASGTETSEGNTTATLNFSTKLKSDIVRAGIAYKQTREIKTIIAAGRMRDFLFRSERTVLI